MATVSTGVQIRTETPEKVMRLERYTCWEKVVTFTLISGDTTGLATIPINGILEKVIIKLSDMAGAEGTTDVSLTDNGDNTIFSVTDLAESASYAYSVSEPLVNEVNVILGFDDPEAGATVTVTLRGI